MIVQAHAQSITGKKVRNIGLQTSADGNYGLAISPDSAHMVASHGDHTLSVYLLPGGERIRKLGSEGAGEGQFKWPAKLCFSASGNVVVADCGNKRVQEVTLTGDHVRFIGAGVIKNEIWGIAANAEVIVVGKYACTSNNRIMMFDAVAGALVRAFGDYGDAPGQLMEYCLGIRFTPDNGHIIVAESNPGVCTGGQVSVFTHAGEFVRCIGGGQFKAALEVEITDNGDIIVCDGWPYHRICVFSADGSTLLRQWGGYGVADGMFINPTALAMCGGQLYVLDRGNKRVQVFQ